MALAAVFSKNLTHSMPTKKNSVPFLKKKKNFKTHFLHDPRCISTHTYLLFVRLAILLATIDAVIATLRFTFSLSQLLANNWCAFRIYILWISRLSTLIWHAYNMHSFPFFSFCVFRNVLWYAFHFIYCVSLLLCWCVLLTLKMFCGVYCRAAVVISIIIGVFFTVISS